MGWLLIAAAVAISAVSIVYRQRHVVKLRIMTHGIPAFDTWYRGSGLREFALSEEAIAYNPWCGVKREVFLTNEAEDRLFSLLFIDAARRERATIHGHVLQNDLDMGAQPNSRWVRDGSGALRELPSR